MTPLPQALQPLSVLLVLGLILILVGCGSSAPTADPGSLPSKFPSHSAEQIQTLVRQPIDTLQSYAADGRVKIQSPQRNDSFNADVRHRRADSLLMRFSLFGIEGGRLLLTPDSAFFHDSRNQQLLVGSLADARRLLPAPVASTAVFANLLGLTGPDPSTTWTVTSDSSLYYLSSPSGRRQWTVDPKRWRVVRYTEKTRDDTVIEKRHYSTFRRVEGVVLPHRILFERPTENLLARIRYENIRLNPSGLSFELDAPPGLSPRPIPGR